MKTGSEAAFAALLARYERFGVALGLTRIEALLTALGQPQRQVPVVHVAGTNGKGSVCAYLSAVLVAAGYRVGRYTSPHLVSWRERICLNEQPIAAADLLAALQQVEAAIAPDQPCPTQFEVLTAAAWLYFAQQQVDIAVIEVGLGGRLDATNVCQEPLVSVITSLSREHWQRLGPTLADIAFEKAGILKPGRPAVVGPLPEAAAAVVQARLAALSVAALWPQPARPLAAGWAELSPAAIAPLVGPPLLTQPLRYPLPFLGQHQLTNSALAVAALLLLRRQGWRLPDSAIVAGMAAARWPGRLQWVTWRDRAGIAQRLLIDGAHNPAAAEGLRAYVDTLPPRPVSGVTWLIGMLATKDHADVFQALLRPGDRLHLVPVPEHQSASPAALATLAQNVCPQLALCQSHANLAAGLAAAFADPKASPEALTVLCGSLYLVGHFFAVEAAS